MLEQLVGVANSTGIGFSITLSVGGSVMTGQLIGRAQYLRELADLLKPKIPAMGQVYGEWADEAERELQAEMHREDEPSGDPEPAPRFIHVRALKVVGAGQGLLPTSSGFLWRGRLDRVDGFAFGEFGPGKSS
jgi:hypothetical protein